ncbi:MAG: hypothetical protein DWH94_05295 [Planctomycetota bacterium]|jgi:hypothetical protein|nr:MAG: hypothetical protein DWH94_05295 [Planctomycetota bacterium]
MRSVAPYDLQKYCRPKKVNEARGRGGREGSQIRSGLGTIGDLRRKTMSQSALSMELDRGLRHTQSHDISRSEIGDLSVKQSSLTFLKHRTSISSEEHFPLCVRDGEIV